MACSASTARYMRLGWGLAGTAISHLRLAAGCLNLVRRQMNGNVRGCPVSLERAGWLVLAGWRRLGETAQVHVSTLIPPMTALRFECQRDVHDNCILGHPPRSFPFNIFFYTFSPISNRLHCQISQHPTDTAATDI